jgi:hypothetical protein
MGYSGSMIIEMDNRETVYCQSGFIGIESNFLHNATERLGGECDDRMIDSELVVSLWRRSYPLPQGWWRKPAGEVGGCVKMVFRVCYYVAAFKNPPAGGIGFF